MPILTPIEFSCDSCGLTIRLPRVPGIMRLPVKIEQGIAGMPPAWSLTEDGRAHCPDHQPRLVQPASPADLGFRDLTAIKGGRG